MRLLLVRSLEGWSYDGTRATLEAFPKLDRKLGLRGQVRTTSTVVMRIERVPVIYLEALLASTVRPFVRGRTIAAGDAIGVGTRQYERSFDERDGKGVRWRRVVKLHVAIAARAQWGFLRFGASRGRFGERVKVRRGHAQRVEILCRIVLRNRHGKV